MELDSPKIKIIAGDGRTNIYNIDKEITTIGRSKDSDIILSDPRVSRNHASITRKRKGYMITDLGSFNGIVVNGKFIQSVLLRHEAEIKIGSAKLIFLTQEKRGPSTVENVVITDESDYEKWHKQTMKIDPEVSCQMDTETLLAISRPKKEKSKFGVSVFPRKGNREQQIQEEFASLERMNKVLFVLYEISRQLNYIHDFNMLLKKIMDLIFMVIDADFGFLILTDDGKEGNLTPIVVKYKDDKVKRKGQIRVSRTIIDKVIQDKVALLTSNAMKDPRLVPSESLVGQKIRSAMCVPLWKREKIIGVIQLDSTRIDNLFNEDDLELIKAIGCQMAMVLEQASLNEKIREEERMINRLERFHSPQVIDMILKSGLDTKDDMMEAKELDVTILFMDIIGFTRLSEEMSPREINMILNQYFSRMTDIIFEYEGTLDKYIGDGLMAVFGAPREKKDDARRAVKAALRMRKELASMMEKATLKRKFNIRIGINTGRVVAGNIGSPKRMEYTVIGDPVNIAFRLESIAKPNQIIIGEKTYRDVKDTFKISKIGPKELKGKSEKIIVFEVLD